jgi:hypothetical protein
MDPASELPDNQNVFEKVPVPPEVIEWALKNFNEEEVLEELRQIRETGGLKLSDFLPELEAIANAKE